MNVILKVAALAVIAVVYSGGTSAAKLYKCVNASGETTYKQTPCADRKQEKVLVHKTPEERRQEAWEARQRQIDQENMERLEKSREDARLRAEQHRAQLQDNRQKRIEAAIDGGYTVVGMSKEEVRMALGEPTSISIPTASMGRATELWVYRTRTKTDYVHFERGQVVSKSGH